MAREEATFRHGRVLRPRPFQFRYDRCLSEESYRRTSQRAVSPIHQPGSNHGTAGLSLWRDKTTKELTLAVGEQSKERAWSTGAGSGKGEHALAGITVEELKTSVLRSRSHGGVVVTDVEAGSPAERAGVRRDDIIREINRKPVRQMRDFEKLTKEVGPHSPVLLLLTRGNATIFLSINPHN